MKEMYNTIKNYFKTLRLLRRENDTLLKSLSVSFGHRFRIDKIGRIYTVINPMVHNLDTGGNTLIYDGNNEPMIKEYLIKCMLLLKTFIGNNNFFDILTYDIKQLDDDQNYLVVLKPIFLAILITSNVFSLFSFLSNNLRCLTLVVSRPKLSLFTPCCLNNSNFSKVVLEKLHSILNSIF